MHVSCSTVKHIAIGREHITAPMHAPQMMKHPRAEFYFLASHMTVFELLTILAAR
jgi:hypothetical protein